MSRSEQAAAEAGDLAISLCALNVSEQARRRLARAARIVPARLTACHTTGQSAQHLVERRLPTVVIVDSLSFADVREAITGAATPSALVAWCGCYTSEVTAALIESGVDEVMHPGMLDVELAARLRHCARR